MVEGEKENCLQTMQTAVCEEDKLNEGHKRVYGVCDLSNADREIDKLDKDGQQRTQVDDNGNSPNNEDDSSSRYPFPPGFGPCFHGETLAAKKTCEKGGLKFDGCDEDIVLSAFITKAKVKSRNRDRGIKVNVRRLDRKGNIELFDAMRDVGLYKDRIRSAYPR
ncbi:hypothetical protein PIB30_028674 [Stylosanthes scabra]|uniref:Uncharacterized protein n=1 Tax=Stylosanthes scabra TaxID=79078 RepID=A0ABU6SCJ9_9FABA|nr:hypothetical protein [Stylosanthes scabra]